MSSAQLEREVAAATGESLRRIRRHGFQLACPDVVDFDPQPSGPPATIDWDEHYRVEFTPYRRAGRSLRRAA